MLTGLDSAFARFAQAEIVIEELGDPGLQARLDYQRASIYGRVGDLASAWAGLEGAVQRLDAFTPREQCSVHLSRGMLAFELTRPQEALDSFAEAARLAHALGGVEQEFMARHNEGYAAYLLGDIPRSLAGMASAELLAADVYRAPARLDRARVMLEAGLVREAAEALQAGLADLPGEGHDQIRAEFDLELARAERLAGHLDRAAVAATSAIETYRRARRDGVGGQGDARRRCSSTSTGSSATTRTGDVEGGDAGVARAAAALADQLVDVAGELGDSELADGARVVAAQALLLAGDAAGCEHPSAESRAGLARLAVRTSSTRPPSRRRPSSPPVSSGPHAASSGAPRGVSPPGRRGAPASTCAPPGPCTACASPSSTSTSPCHEAAGPCSRCWSGGAARPTGCPRWAAPTTTQLASLTEQLRSVRGLLRHEHDPEQLRGLEVDASRLERMIRDRDWALSRRAHLPSRARAGARGAGPPHRRRPRPRLVLPPPRAPLRRGGDRWASGPARPHAVQRVPPSSPSGCGSTCVPPRPTTSGRCRARCGPRSGRVRPSSTPGCSGRGVRAAGSSS